MSSFQLQFSLFIDQLHICGHKLEAKRGLKNSVVSCTVFFHFVHVFCQAPISTMGFGILWTSMPEGIALPWRWITMLPPPAMQPLSQGSTLGTATILEVGCFREVFMVQVFSCSPLSSPQVRSLQLRTKVRIDFWTAVHSALWAGWRVLVKPDRERASRTSKTAVKVDYW